MDEDFARRMYIYNYRLFDRYNREVASLAVLADERPEWRPSAFHSTLWGCTAGLEFPVVKLLDYADDDAALEANANPFAVVVLAHLKTQQTSADPLARQAWKLRLVKGLYQRGLDRHGIQRLFRVIDWLMDLPKDLGTQFWHELRHYEKEKHMPYVTSVERMAIERVREEAWREALLDNIQFALEFRFGARGKKLMPRVRRIKDLASLEDVRFALKTASDLAALRKLLP